MGQRVKLISDRRERWVRRRNESGLIGIRNVPEENFFLPFQNAEQSATGNDLPVCRKTNVVEFVACSPGVWERTRGDNLAVVSGILVEIHDCEKIGVSTRLVPGANEEVFRFVARPLAYRPEAFLSCFGHCLAERFRVLEFEMRRIDFGLGVSAEMRHCCETRQ